MFDEDTIDELEAAGVDEVKVRTALTCETRFGMCAKCYGCDLGRGGLSTWAKRWVIAAQSIGEPGTQLTMRTFHIGGAASRAAIASSGKAKSNGSIGFQRHHALREQQQGRAGGDCRVPAKSSSHDEHGRERERHKVPYGAIMAIKPDQQIKAGTILANWDPLTRPSSPNTPDR